MISEICIALFFYGTLTQRTYIFGRIGDVQSSAAACCTIEDFSANILIIGTIGSIPLSAFCQNLYILLYFHYIHEVSWCLVMVRRSSCLSGGCDLMHNRWSMVCVNTLLLVQIILIAFKNSFDGAPVEEHVLLDRLWALWQPLMEYLSNWTLFCNVLQPIRGSMQLLVELFFINGNHVSITLNRKRYPSDSFLWVK